MAGRSDESSAVRAAGGDVQNPAEGMRETPRNVSEGNGDVEKAAAAAAMPNGSPEESEGEKAKTAQSPSGPPQQAERKKPSKIKQLWEKSGLDMYERSPLNLMIWHAWVLMNSLA